MATREKVMAAYDEKLTLRQIAAKAGVKYHAAWYQIKRKRKLPTADGYETRRKTNLTQVIAAVSSGLNFGEVGRQFDISRERVRQLVVIHETTTGEVIERHRAARRG